MKRSKELREKSKVRTRMRVLRLDLDADFVSNLSQKIADKIQKILAAEHPAAVAIYQPIHNEVDTQFLVDVLTKSGIRIYIPQKNQNHDYEFVPLDDKNPTQANPNFDMIICPGLAFDRRGTRLGYGKGIYDRLLAAYPRAKKIGICYDFQLVDELPFEPHDVKMDVVVTEKQVIEI